MEEEKRNNEQRHANNYNICILEGVATIKVSGLTRRDGLS